MRYTSLRRNQASRRSSGPFFRKPSADSFFSAQESLPKDTPAWSTEGSIFLGPSFFTAAPDLQDKIIRHESVHATHQQTAPVDNTASARAHAEDIASAGSTPDAVALGRPAPALLAFPAQSHKPWTQVYLGAEFLVGEITIQGILFRIQIPYSDIGIKETTKKATVADMEMDMIDKTSPQLYHCGKHPHPSLVPIEKKLKQIAGVADAANKKIPATSIFRTKLIVLHAGANDAYRTAFGAGMLVLDSNTMNLDILNTVGHETAHGIFEHHSTAADADPKKRQPDSLALNIADLFLKLSNTRSAPVPTQKFSKAAPPSLDGSGKPAGLIMVHDTLWSGRGGHPWQGVDEFFASAYGAYTREKKLFDQIIAFYTAYDPDIKPLAASLLSLLAKVGDTKALGALKRPAGADAGKELDTVTPPPDFTPPASSTLPSGLLDPSTIVGPASIVC